MALCNKRTENLPDLQVSNTLFKGTESYVDAQTKLKYDLIRNAEDIPFEEKKIMNAHYSKKEKVGFFSQERSSQTDLSETVNLKEMMVVVNSLLSDIAELKKDVHISKQMMAADYQSTIKNTAIQLYTRINTRVEELEQRHKKRVSIIRRSYKQQLNNALISLKVLYEAKLESQTRHMGKTNTADREKDLRSAVARSESVISMLQLQLEATKAQANRQPSPIVEAEDEESEDDKSSIDNSEEIGRQQVIIDELRRENSELDTRIHALEEDLYAKEQTLIDLHNQLSRTKEAAQQYKDSLDRLKNEVKIGASAVMLSPQKGADEESRINAEIERRATEMAAEALAIEQKRREDKELMCRNYETIILNLQDQLTLTKKQKDSGRIEFEVYKLERDRLEEDKHRLENEALRAEIERLVNEVSRVHIVWEKKFSILQQSLHVLKDESYIRQGLERQSAQTRRGTTEYKRSKSKASNPSVKSERTEDRFSAKIFSERDQILSSTEAIPTNVTVLQAPQTH